MRAVGLRDATDREIFHRARANEVIIMSKDEDFLRLLDEWGPPPAIIWITAGNTSNAKMRELLSKYLQLAVDLIKRGEPLVEIDGD